MRLTASCKHCGVPMFVECSDDYAAMRDPHGLIGMLTCHKCIAKYRELLRREYHSGPLIIKLETEILNRCNWIAREKEAGGIVGTLAQQELRVACEAYANCLADLCAGTPLGVDDLLASLLEQPEQVEELLRGFRSAVEYEAKAVREGA